MCVVWKKQYTYMYLPVRKNQFCCESSALLVGSDQTPCACSGKNEKLELRDYILSE